MHAENGVYNQYDYEAAKILADFLPDKIFDAHAHLYDQSFIPNMCGPDTCFALRKRCEVSDYLEDMAPLFGPGKEVRLNILTTPDPTMADPSTGNREASTAFLKEQLEKYPGNVGSVMVSPDDTPEDIEKQLVHPAIRGFKCYHVLAKKKPTWHATIGEFLPEAAWQVADQRGLTITLHMVRDQALADPENLNYIRAMAKKYPNAQLILAHAARSFAAWTALETVDQIADLDNIWYDFAAVCESPAMFQIMRKVGVERCMWASDYPISRSAGKAISIADSFYWIITRDLDQFAGPTEFHYWQIGTENLMATRQACLMLDLNQDAIEDLFYNNAMRLFGLK